MLQANKTSTPSPLPVSVSLTWCFLNTQKPQRTTIDTNVISFARFSCLAGQNTIVELMICIFQSLSGCVQSLDQCTNYLLCTFISVFWAVTYGHVCYVCFFCFFSLLAGVISIPLFLIILSNVTAPTQYT